MRLDVVDLLVAQYPGTAPTRILLVGTRDNTMWLGVFDNVVENYYGGETMA